MFTLKKRSQEKLSLKYYQVFQLMNANTMHCYIQYMFRALLFVAQLPNPTCHGQGYIASNIFSAAK